jgi:hypothetical protein
MRHFVVFLSLPLTPQALPGRVPPRTTAASLIPPLGPLKRLTTPDLCALAGAVHVTAIAQAQNIMPITARVRSRSIIASILATDKR